MYQKAESKFLDDNLKKLQENKFFGKQTVGHIDNLQMNRLGGETDITANFIKNDMDLQDGSLARKRPISTMDEPLADSNEPQPPTKVWKGIRYKIWSMGAIQPAVKYKKPSEREITEVS